LTWDSRHLPELKKEDGLYCVSFTIQIFQWFDRRWSAAFIEYGKLRVPRSIGFDVSWVGGCNCLSSKVFLTTKQDNLAGWRGQVF
jgi:hypothetical protein